AFFFEDLRQGVPNIEIILDDKDVAGSLGKRHRPSYQQHNMRAAQRTRSISGPGSASRRGPSAPPASDQNDWIAVTRARFSSGVPTVMRTPARSSALRKCLTRMPAFLNFR